MNLKEIEKIIEMMNENNILEFSLEKEGIKICLKKEGTAPLAPQTFVHQQIPSYHQVPQHSEAPAASSAPVVSEPEGKFEYVCSPIVGTYYQSPAPDADPFVRTGQAIEPDQVVCIIEAMKVMNEIKSDFAGVLEEILVENGDPVEFGQKIFKIKIK